MILSVLLRPAPRHYQIGILHSGLYEFLVGGFDKFVVRFQHAFKRTSSLYDISLQSTCESQIVVSVNKDFEVEVLLIDLSV